MATHDDGDTSGQYEIPDTDEYEQATREVRDVELEEMGFVLPVYQRPPGRLMTAMEEYGLGGMFGPGESDMEQMMDDDGSIGLNTFMRTEIVPNVAVERTNKDAVHWNNPDVANDPDVNDFDLSVLSNPDLASLIQGMLVGDEVEPEELDKFQG
jgi:hypothetical protein